MNLAETRIEGSMLEGSLGFGSKEEYLSGIRTSMGMPRLVSTGRVLVKFGQAL